MKKTTVLSLAAATFIALAAPAFAAPPAASSTPAAVSSASHQAAAPNVVSRAQTKLKADNLYTGAINGQRDAATIASIRSFQTAHHLTVNGRLDAATRRALGI
jgi:peptidoglycan hydrolase-like protein with peptidoglycan-binding domain